MTLIDFSAELCLEGSSNMLKCFPSKSGHESTMDVE